jgi:hypothetical protein
MPVRHWRSGPRWLVARIADGSASPAADVVISKDMGITHADFFRIIPLVLKGERYRLHSAGVDIERDGVRIQVRLEAEGARRLGSFALPRTVVTLHFFGCNEAAVKAFMVNFDTRFRRGGG